MDYKLDTKISLTNFWAIARYEIFSILNSWLFRIFAGSILAILITLDIVFYSTVAPVPYAFRALSSFIPYANLIMTNIGQTAILIFIATDIFKRDKKYNTTEVIYIRSLTNSTYLFGKAIGITLVFTGFNLVILFICLIIHLIFSDVNFVFLPYLLYPLIITIPTLIFTIGLTFLLMRLVRNQAVVILLLLGYLALSLFYLSNEVYYLFDFTSLHLPVIYSDFVGITNMDLVIYQRGLYIFSGIIFIFITTLLFDRLPQSHKMKIITPNAIIGLLVCLVLFAYNYLWYYFDDQSLRKNIRELNQKYSETANITTKDCLLDLEHQGEKIEVIAKIKVINKTNTQISKPFFSINPGLKVTKVLRQNQEIQFNQNLHILEIPLPSPPFAG